MVTIVKLGKRIVPKRLYAEWRSVYPIYINEGGEDDLIAFLAIKAGWGKCWYVHPLILSELDPAQAVVHMGCTPYSCRESKYIQGTGNAAKEAAVMFLMDEKNRANFPTCRQLIDRKSQAAKRKRDNLTTVLAANIKTHAMRLRQVDALRELLKWPVEINTRLSLGELLGEVQSAADKCARDVEVARAQLLEAARAVPECAVVPEGTQS